MSSTASNRFIVKAAMAFVSVAAPAFFATAASAVVIPGVKASATSFDSLGYEGYGVFSVGGSQLIPGSFGGFGSAAVGSVRSEFIRGPWKMVDGSGLAESPTNPGSFFHYGNSYAEQTGPGSGNPFWLSIDGPLSGPKTLDVYPPRHVKDIVDASDGVRYTMGPDVRPQVVFDLGGLYDVDSFRIWNWCEAYGDVNTGFVDSEGTARGVRDILINGSVDGVNFFPIRAARIPKANPIQVVTNTYFGSNILLNDNANEVRYIQFDITNNWAGDLANLNIPAGIAEVQFTGTAIIPEPAALSMLALPALALVRRRRA